MSILIHQGTTPYLCTGVMHNMLQYQIGIITIMMLHA